MGRGRRCGTEGGGVGQRVPGCWKVEQRRAADGADGVPRAAVEPRLPPSAVPPPSLGSHHRNRKRAVPEPLCTEHRPGHSPLSACGPHWVFAGEALGSPPLTDRSTAQREVGAWTSPRAVHPGRSGPGPALHTAPAALVIQGRVSPLLPILSPRGGGHSITPTNLFGICSRSHINTWEGKL